VIPNNDDDNDDDDADKDNIHHHYATLTCNFLVLKPYRVVRKVSRGIYIE